MKITPQAQKVLHEVIEQNGADGLLATIAQSCCGSSPVFQLARFEEGDQPEVIDGVSIVFDPAARDAVEDVIIDLEGNDLVVLNPVCSCSQGCEGHDHDDHDCCHDHHEEHEGGCCHGGGCCHE